MMSTIRVAIIGGGVAGASLMHAIIQNCPNIDAHIFESSKTFGEGGVAMGISRNAQEALKLIGQSAFDCIAGAGGVNMDYVCFAMGAGQDAETPVFEYDTAKLGMVATSIVERKDLLHQLFAVVPRERMHASKKVDSIRYGGDEVSVRFQDGTNYECDILIGADGIHSTVRQTILGKDDPKSTPWNSGSWAIMTLNNSDDTRELLKLDRNRNTEYGGIGDNGFIMTNILSGGSRVQFTVTGWDKEAQGTKDWRRRIGKDELTERFVNTNWTQYYRKAVAELLCKEPEQEAIYLWYHLPARTYVDGPLCIMGDAAHAMTPFQASGAGTSLEDSMILSSLLRRAKSSKEAQTALKAYDRIRRPRTQQIVDSSWLTGQMMLGIHPETGTNAHKLKAAMGPRWDFILEIDMKGHESDALDLMKSLMED